MLLTTVSEKEEDVVGKVMKPLKPPFVALVDIRLEQLPAMQEAAHCQWFSYNQQLASNSKYRGKWLLLEDCKASKFIKPHKCKGNAFVTKCKWTTISKIAGQMISMPPAQWLERCS